MHLSQIVRPLYESSEPKRRLATEQVAHVGRASRALTAALSVGGEVLLFGNGGSANVSCSAAVAVGMLVTRHPAHICPCGIPAYGGGSAVMGNPCIG
jgi:phosphoheptose isomerase